MVKKTLTVLAAILLVSCAPSGLNTEKLPSQDTERVKTILAKLEPLIETRDKSATLSTLTFDELYAPLNSSQKNFMKAFRALDAKKLGVKIPYRGIATGKTELAKITGQKVLFGGKETELPPQFLPGRVYECYLEMMVAMEQDLGRRLYIESGYRSSAYQLYLFVYYLKNHGYSIRETVKWVALPGFSEHGSPEHQAIDFINRDGISGETDPAAFEKLPEYEWLLKNAGRFGFILSYPKEASTTFEPWHWRLDKQ